MTLSTAAVPRAPANVERARPPKPLAPPILLDHVSKWYGSVIAVNDVSVAVHSGIVALLGPNGAGKSSLMKLITGQLRPSIGRVRLFGRNVRRASVIARLGYCPDVDAFYEEMSGRRFVQTLLKLSGFRGEEVNRRAEAAIETVGMSDRADVVIRGCSKGMRQRIKLAQAIAHDPDLLVLDEPLSGLDPIGRREFCALFRQFADAGKTILISSHVLSEVESIADSVILVGAGRTLTQGTWREVAEFLSALPQQVRVTSPDVRALAADLVGETSIQTIEFRGSADCLVTTTDPRGLCDRIGELVRDRRYNVDRLSCESNWGETLFGLAKDF